MPRSKHNRKPPPKEAHRKVSRPIATVAYYGPPDQCATKAVVGLAPSEHNREPTALKKWFSQGKDVRNDPEIITEMTKFILEHNPEQVAIMDRIIG